MSAIEELIIEDIEQEKTLNQALDDTVVQEKEKKSKVAKEKVSKAKPKAKAVEKAPKVPKVPKTPKEKKVELDVIEKSPVLGWW